MLNIIQPRQAEVHKNLRQNVVQCDCEDEVKNRLQEKEAVKYTESLAVTISSTQFPVWILSMYTCIIRPLNYLLFVHIKLTFDSEYMKTCRFQKHSHPCSSQTWLLQNVQCSCTAGQKKAALKKTLNLE